MRYFGKTTGTAILISVLCTLSLDALGDSRIARPDCWDYHACGVSQMTHQEYTIYWMEWGMSPPLALRNGPLGT